MFCQAISVPRNAVEEKFGLATLHSIGNGTLCCIFVSLIYATCRVDSLYRMKTKML